MVNRYIGTSLTMNKSIINTEIFKAFQEIKGEDLFNHSQNACCIEDFLSIMYVLSPDMIEINGYAFVADLFFQGEKINVEETIKILEERFNYDKKSIEQFVNSMSLGEFFLGTYTKSVDDENLFNEFVKAIVYYWKRRAKEAFPNKNMIIEVGNEIMGELGLTITMYEEVGMSSKLNN